MKLDPLGFRECDGRWRYGGDIDTDGLTRVGHVFGRMVQQRGLEPRVLSGHDFRSYSAEAAAALIKGLRQSGCTVVDMGLTITPSAYFTQIHQNISALAMLTASHNPDGWTGVKLSLAPRSTLMPGDMDELRTLACGIEPPHSSPGRLIGLPEANAAYIAGFHRGTAIPRPLRAVVACGNGTASLFAPPVLENAGIHVEKLDCGLDARFPNCDPNPEDMRMLERLGEAVRRHGADLGFAFDGDGDRCGVVDETGKPISADKAGLLLARHLAARSPGSRFVVDVKSTGLFASDPVLRQLGAATEYWKTGHSHMRRRMHETGALAAFEKSGHMFFTPPDGHGYDDACVAALAICRMLAEHRRPLSALCASLQSTWVSPTMSPHCADDEKHRVTSAIRAHYERCMTSGIPVAGQPIAGIDTACGVRFTLSDGSWGLVRASSNKPELAVVCESTESAEALGRLFADVESHLRTYPEVGAFNQTLGPPS